jgi:chemotaxis protein histidine kinase CheA
MDAFRQQQAAVQQQIKEEQQRIEELRQELAARPGDPNDPTRQQLLQDLQDLEQALGAGDLTREEALAQLSSTESKLQQLVDAQAPGEQAALDALGRQLAQSDNPAARQAAEALKNNRPDAAAEALKGIDPSKMTEEQRQALADALRQAAQDAAANDPNLAQRLNDAAQALESNDPAAAQRALENLANDVNQTGQNTLSQQELEQALAQIQQSKQGLAGAGQPTPLAQNGTPGPSNGTPNAYNGTPGAYSGTPQAMAGTPVSVNGTPVSISGTPVTGTLALTGTPVVIPGTPGQGTPVVVPGQQPGPGQGSAQGPGIGTGHTEPLAVPPSTLNAQGTPVGLSARPNSGETNTGSVNSDPNAGSVQVPYEDVYGSYAAQAQQTLGQEYVPSGMKEYVQQYFTSLAPPGP